MFLVLFYGIWCGHVKHFFFLSKEQKEVEDNEIDCSWHRSFRIFELFAFLFYKRAQVYGVNLFHFIRFFFFACVHVFMCFIQFKRQPFSTWTTYIKSDICAQTHICIFRLTKPNHIKHNFWKTMKRILFFFFLFFGNILWTVYKIHKISTIALTKYSNIIFKRKIFFVLFVFVFFCWIDCVYVLTSPKKKKIVRKRILTLALLELNEKERRKKNSE